MCHLSLRQVHCSGAPASGKLQEDLASPVTAHRGLDAQHESIGAFMANRDTGQWKIGFGKKLWDKLIFLPHPFKICYSTWSPKCYMGKLSIWLLLGVGGFLKIAFL